MKPTSLASKALSTRVVLPGILALSTYLPLADTLEREAAPANLDVPIFMAHGKQDGVIPHAFAVQSGRFLRTQGYPLEWRDYRLEHGVSMEELRDVENWLAKVLV